MSPGAQHAIANLEMNPGELAFDVRIGDIEQRVYFRSETEVTPLPEAALAAALLPAMRSGGSLEMREPISPRVLRTQREFQAIQRAWSLSWPFGDPPLEEVEVTAPVRAPEVRQPVGRVAAFFSGGVDSWATVLENPDVTDLIFVRGFDILPRLEHQKGLADQVENRLRLAADELGLPLHVVETNLRDLSDAPTPEQPLARWDTYFGCGVSAVALFFGSAFDRVLIAGDSDYEVMDTRGAAWMVDQLWSTENLEIVDDGGRFSRVERTEMIAPHPVVQRSLRVCWENPGGAYNCGHCQKCLLTMATLEAAGALEAVQTFPDDLDLEMVADATPSVLVRLALWEDVLDASRRAGLPELERAVAAAVTAGQRHLQLPAGYRRRKLPGPPPAAGNRANGERSLMTTPETAAQIAASGAVALLVGGYDGSGNFGDLAQLDAALGLLGELGSDLLILPVIEQQFVGTHRMLAPEFVHSAEHVVYFDGGGDPGGEDLVPVSAPEDLGLAISYLYGGGFLNPSWGERKLAMLRAVESVIEGAGHVIRFASGLQADSAWVSGLDSAELEMLRRFELWGGRDDASTEVLAELGARGSTINTGDDALGILAAMDPAGAPSDDSVIEVNVHYAEHEWVTGHPDAVLELDVGILAALSRLGGRGVRVRPLLAYLDPRIDDRPGQERFAAACAEHGIEVAEPRVLRPANVVELASEIGAADLTISSSYHVALTSLLLAIPTALLRDNDYYSQKALGLMNDFGLPDTFSPRSGDDPERAASEIAPHLLDPKVRAQTRGDLSAFASQMRQRRVEVERKLVTLIAGHALAAAATNTAGSRSEPAGLEAKLEEVLGSRSWRITAPLRRLSQRGR